MDFELIVYVAGSKYKALVDENKRVKEAWVYVKAHDKAPTWRRIVRSITLNRVQWMVNKQLIGVT